jgi:hypothetical protein
MRWSAFSRFANTFQKLSLMSWCISDSLAALVDSPEQIRNSLNQIERLGTHGIPV